MTKATELRELASLTTIASGQIKFDTDVMISGDLLTSGNTITISADELNIEDKNITLASGSANSAVADGAGITIDGANAVLEWSHSENAFVTNQDLNIGAQFTFDRTTDLFTINNNSNTGGVNIQGDNGRIYFNGLRAIEGASAGSLHIGEGFGNLYLRDNTTVTGGLVVDNNVAIGTTDADVSLHIGDGTTDEFIILDKGSSSTSGILFRNAGNNKVKLQVNPEEGLEFHTNNTRKMSISESGAVSVEQVRHSIRPTLNLDFANSKELDPRITFYRDSIATYYDSKGILRYANTNTPRFDHDPATGESKGLLIEEARENKVSASENMLSSIYASSNIRTYVRDNSTRAPDGTFGADQVLETTESLEHRFLIDPPLTGLSGVDTTCSVFVKRVGPSARNIYFMIQSGVDAYYAHFDFDNVTVHQSSGNGSGVLLGAGIEELSDGWFRIYISGNISASSLYNQIYFETNTRTGFTPQSYEGDGSGFAIWGWQVEQGTFPTSYIPSDTRFTSRSSVATYHDETGILRTAPANSPRYGYKYDGRKWVETGLILENAATNLFNYSAELKEFNPNRGTKTLNAGTAPDGSNTAIYVRDQVSGSGEHAIIDSTSLSAGTYTTSFYAKAGEITEVGIHTYSYTYGDNYLVFANLTTGEITYDPGNTGTIEYVGDGWYRISVTNVISASVTCNTWIYSIVNGSISHTDGGTGKGYYIWGAQLESGSAPTSFIYTNSASVTRSADVASSVAYARAKDYGYMKVDDWYNTDENGTVYLDVNALQAFEDGIQTTFVGISEDTNLGTTNSKFVFHTSSTAGRLWLRSDSSQQNADSNTGTRIRLASSYDDDTVRTRYVDGSNTTKAFLDMTAGNTSVSKYLVFGDQVATGYEGNFTIKQFAYYPEAFNADELTALVEE